jgi:hypothetical protein
MILKNLFRFPKSHDSVNRLHPLFYTLTRPILAHRADTDLKDARQKLSSAATVLAGHLNAPNILLSDEDFVGGYPTRSGISGLYPFIGQFLPTIQENFERAGHSSHFVFYVRDYGDWLASLHAYRYLDQPRQFKPKRFKKLHALPDDWQDVQARLISHLGAENITFVNYENDRANLRLGTALFKIFGLSDEIINSFDWIAPVNVTRPKTVDPNSWR